MPFSRRPLRFLLSNWGSERTTRSRCILLIYIQLQDHSRESRGSPYLAGRSTENWQWACRSLELLLESRACCNWPMPLSRPEGEPPESFVRGWISPAITFNHHRESCARAKRTIAHRECCPCRPMEDEACGRAVVGWRADLPLERGRKGHPESHRQAPPRAPEIDALL